MYVYVFWALLGVAWGRIDQVLMGKQEVRHVLQVDRSEKVRLIQCFVVAAGLLWDRKIDVGCSRPEEEGLEERREDTHQAMRERWRNCTVYHEDYHGCFFFFI